jgi:hypothetical protein
MYIKTDGSVAYTQAHSASKPDLASDLVGTALSNAGYWSINGTGWTACQHHDVPAPPPQLYATNYLWNTRGATCTAVSLKVRNQPMGQYRLSPPRHDAGMALTSSSDRHFGSLAVLKSSSKPSGMVHGTAEG